MTPTAMAPVIDGCVHVDWVNQKEVVEYLPDGWQEYVGSSEGQPLGLSSQLEDETLGLLRVRVAPTTLRQVAGDEAVGDRHGRVRRCKDLPAVRGSGAHIARHGTGEGTLGDVVLDRAGGDRERGGQPENRTSVRAGAGGGSVDIVLANDRVVEGEARPGHVVTVGDDGPVWGN